MSMMLHGDRLRYTVKIKTYGRLSEDQLEKIGGRYDSIFTYVNGGSGLTYIFIVYDLIENMDVPGTDLTFILPQGNNSTW